MNFHLPAAFVRSFAALALCSAFAAQAAPEDWQTVAASCQPTSTNALSQAVINPGNNGSIRANAGDGQLKYVCNVLDSFATSTTLNWFKFRLQAVDPVGGSVGAQLYAKDKTTGAVTLVATVVAGASPNIQNLSVPVPALHFDNFAYHVVITINRLPGGQPAAHMVSLTLL